MTAARHGSATSSVTTNDTRLHAYADVDEANAQLGVAFTHDLEEDVRAVLIHVQNDLFDVGADLCTPVVADPEYPPLRIEQDYVDRLEAWCDHYNADLPALRSFILNGGTPGAARSTSRAPSYAGPSARVGGVRGARADDEQAGDHLPEQALRPAVHPGQVRQPGAR